MKKDLTLNILKELIIFAIKNEKLSNSNIQLIIGSDEFLKLSKKIKALSKKELFRTAYRHRLIEFIFENNFIKFYMKEIHEDFRLMYEKLFLINLKKQIYVKDLLEIFQKNEVELILLKGIAISLQSKGSYTSRISGDLDLFIKKEDLMKSLKIMRESDYIIKHNYFPKKINKYFENFFTFIFYEISLEKKFNDFFYVDLHWKLTNYNSNLTNFKDAYRASTLVKYNNLKFHSLNNYDSLRYACAHAAKDKWFCVSNLLDIHFLAKKFTKEELKKFAKDKEVRISLFATYLITKEEHYELSELTSSFEKIYISFISKIFQNLDSKSKGINEINCLNKIIYIFHELYLANSFKDLIVFFIRTFWYNLPNFIKSKFNNKKFK